MKTSIIEFLAKIFQLAKAVIVSPMAVPILGIFHFPMAGCGEYNTLAKRITTIKTKFFIP